MSADFQTIAALIVVALTVAWFVVRGLRKRDGSNCGDSCGAVSPEIRKLQARLKRSQ